MIALDELAEDRVAQILATLLTTPEGDRLQVLAVAIRAALDAGIVTHRIAERRAA